MYEKYLEETYRAMTVKTWGSSFGRKNDLFLAH